MGKIKYLAKRICNMSFDGMFNAVNEVHDKTGKNKVGIFFDVVFCGFKYQAGYMDYKLFEMYKMNGKERKTVITRGINNSIIKRYNDPEAMKAFHDKTMFNERYDKYLGRDWIKINVENFSAFEEFCGKHPEFVAKPIGLQCGKGVEVIDTNGKDLKEVFDKLINNAQLLLEERVTQCEALKELHPDSINTLRVVTLNAKVVAAFLRIGNKHNHVDNFNAEGLAAPVDIKDGQIKYKALAKSGELYENHPLTGVPIVGLTIPRWNEVVDFCESAAKVEPKVGYVGWDVCVRDNDIVFIEANEFPGHDIYGLPPHRSKNEGLLPVFEAAMGWKVYSK